MHIRIKTVLTDILFRQICRDTTAAILTPSVDVCHTARHALSLIATSRPPAVITALSKEVGYVIVMKISFVL